MEIAAGLLREIWKVFTETSFYIIFGVFIAGLIHMFVNRYKVTRYLGKGGAKSVLIAAIAGIPLPLCLVLLCLRRYR